MNDLKEYTLKIASKGDKLIEYSGGSFVVCEVFDDNKKKYSIPKTKKDGKTSVAYQQIQKVDVGDTITVAVDEKEFTNDKGTFTRRTIRTIKGDEHNTPYTDQPKEAPVSDFKQGITEKHIADLTKRVEALERQIGGKDEEVEEIPDINLDEDVKEEDLPF